jgi:hypothetical protein
MMLEVRWLYSWHDVPTSVMRNNKLSLTNDEPDEVYETGQVEEVSALTACYQNSFCNVLRSVYVLCHTVHSLYTEMLNWPYANCTLIHCHRTVVAPCWPRVGNPAALAYTRSLTVQTAYRSHACRF